MKLIEYLDLTGERDEEFAARVSRSKETPCTIHAVRKWKAGVRTPRTKAMVRIKRITKEAVCPEDWVS